MFKALTSFVYLCSLKALGDFDSFLQEHGPFRFARLLPGQVLCVHIAEEVDLLQIMDWENIGLWFSSLRSF